MCGNTDIPAILTDHCVKKSPNGVYHLRPSLVYVDSVVAAQARLRYVGILLTVPRPGIELVTLHWELGVLSTGSAVVAPPSLVLLQ